MTNKSTIMLLLAIVVLIATATNISAQPSKGIELTADTIEYDSVQGVMIAKGGVQLTQNGAVMTGSSASYNTKTKEAYVTGGVRVVREGTVLTAAEVRSYNDNHVIASGDVLMIKDGSRLSGPSIDYYIDRNYALIDGGASLTTDDGSMTANKLEAFLTDDRIVGTGSVHIVSTKNSVDATSDQATYYDSKTGNGKAVLTGNARAVQNGNVLTGNTLTIYMGDKAMQADGRPKLVIQ